MLTTLTILSRDQGNIYVPPPGCSRDQQTELMHPVVVKPTSGRWTLRNIAGTLLRFPTLLRIQSTSPRHL